MKISIIIPTFEPGERIVSTIDSVISQTFDKYEIIIQDGSPSESVEKLIGNKYPDSDKITIYHEPDGGVYDAMNHAVKQATGDYGFFMGAGDTLHDNKVLEDFARVSDTSAEDIIYGYWIEISGEKRKTVVRKLDWKYAVKFSPVNHQAVIAKMELLRKYPFDTKYKIAADQDWLLKMKKLGKSIHFIDRPISDYLLDGLSTNNTDIFVVEQKEIHGKYYPFWRMIRHTWRKLSGKDKW